MVRLYLDPNQVDTEFVPAVGVAVMPPGACCGGGAPLAVDTVGRLAGHHIVAEAVLHILVVVVDYYTEVVDYTAEVLIVETVHLLALLQQNS